MVRVIKISNFVGLLIFALLVSGCGINDVSKKLKWLDEKAGEVFDEFEIEQTGTTTPDSDLESASSTEDGDGLSWWPFKHKEAGQEADSEQEITKISADELNKKDKEKIDDWLKQNNYNRYGDPNGTYYAGGTPLFNEATGERMERFEYILEQHPNIIHDANAAN